MWIFNIFKSKKNINLNPPKLTDAELDKIYSDMDDLMWKCHFNNMDFRPVDEVLQSIDIPNVGTDVILAYLINSRAAKDRLEYREEFWEKSKIRLKELNKDWRKLIIGLK